MPESATPKGSTVYRIAFAVFIIACLINAFDSYSTHVRLMEGLLHQGDAQEYLYEACGFLGLSFILVLEGVGLMMFKWTKRAVSNAL